LSGTPAPTASSIAPGEERDEDCIKVGPAPRTCARSASFPVPPR
jgi:hypothetical protein